MSTLASTQSTPTALPVALVAPTSRPWGDLVLRIRAALDHRSYFVASAADLGVLWRGERVDSVERRRRILVFAAQHHWKVETQVSGSSARFLVSPPSGLFPCDSLSRNHE